MPHTLHLDHFISSPAPPVKVMAAYHTSSSMHSHDFFEMVYVKEGYCLHHTAESSALIMEGDIFILPPGMAHRYSGNRVTRIYNCIFDRAAFSGGGPGLETLPGLQGILGENASMVRMHLSLPERKIFLRLITAMEEDCLENPLGWQWRLPACLIQLLVEFARAGQKQEEGGGNDSAYPQYVRQVFSMIDSRYHDPDLTVHQMAEMAGVSDDYLTRQFRRITGISTQEYLRRYRFARAMELLQSGETVSRAAVQTGFRTLSYFSREFTKELGVTPSQYRNQSMET